MSAIELKSLSKQFGSLTAVNTLSFTVGEGELFGLVGPDGAGKTTTLRMLAGVLSPTEGDALVGGISIVRDPEGVKHRIAYMSQRFGLYTDLTVRENIDFYADLYCVPKGERAKRIERLYQFSNLGPFEYRLAGQLSGGMKQKLSLCCALIHRPDILLLDEPTFGVDPISRRDLWFILHEMVHQGITVLVSTAYMDEAERCDHVALLDHGSIIALDTPAVLQRSLSGDMIAIRVADPRRALQILGALRPAPGAVLFGDTIHLRLDSKARDWPAAEGALISAGLAVLESHEVEPSLEDVFIERVAGQPSVPV